MTARARRSRLAFALFAVAVGVALILWGVLGMGGASWTITR